MRIQIVFRTDIFRKLTLGARVETLKLTFDLKRKGFRLFSSQFNGYVLLCETDCVCVFLNLFL